MIDFILAVIGLLLLSPIFLIVLILIMFYIGGNPFFTQNRPGLHERIFKLIKFKSMLDLRDVNGEYLPDSERLSKFGSFLRKLSLDEIPQLINVVKGDMSLVGPRPLLIEYLPYYNETQKRRHDVKPGITGWAQVNGRNTLNWEQKFNYDVWYVDHMSFFLDCKIIWMTLLKVLKTDGVLSPAHHSITKFRGSD